MVLRSLHALAASAITLGAATPAQAQARFDEVSRDRGLAGIATARALFADLNSDGRPDIVLDRHRVFMNRAEPSDPHSLRFEEISTTLPTPRDGDLCVFADLDNDGFPDAVVVRYRNPAANPPRSEDERTCWMRGRGDGTFDTPRIIHDATDGTSAAVAVGDADRDGLLDLWIGNWYAHYGESNEGMRNDLLLQRRDPDGHLRFERRPLPSDDVAFDEETDAGGRPTYGVMIASVLRPDAALPATDLAPVLDRPQLLELNYGRRWNRLLLADGRDVAPDAGLDGDEIRHGRYPGWLREIAKRDPRFDRDDEKPYRANGNTFDAAIGDVDNDGDFDLFLAEITHAWAGDSSDRSRFLVNDTNEQGRTVFRSPPRLAVDRVPGEDADETAARRWNQGDLFCELADLDHDGRLDLVLSSGDYPDPPPFDERLRIYLQQPDGTFKDATADSGIDHPGSQQFSLADVDNDGDLDILAGQAFNRFTEEMIAAQPEGTPRVRLFLNRTAAAAADARSITLRLVGDPKLGVNRDALGAVVTLTTRRDGITTTQTRQLLGIGGHAGKQHDFIVHFGWDGAECAESIEIRWPDAAGTTTRHSHVRPGAYTARLADGVLEPAHTIRTRPAP